MSKLTFNRKPMPILAEHRPLYKITQLLMVLGLASRGKKSSLIRLHLFSWVLKDPKRKAVLLESVNRSKILFGVWGIDPAVNYSLQYALAEGMVERSGVSYKLTVKGAGFVSKVSENKIFEVESDYLKLLGISVTESMVQSIVEGWA
jgi:hypothetical protein